MRVIIKYNARRLKNNLVRGAFAAGALGTLLFFGTGQSNNRKEAGVAVATQETSVSPIQEFPRAAFGDAPEHSFRPVTRIYIGDDNSVYKSILKNVAPELGLSYDLLENVLMAESGGRRYARSDKGAMGYMGLRQICIDAINRGEMGIENEFLITKPYDTKQNIRGGARYLKALIDELRDPRLALAAYNWGIGSVMSAVRSNGYSLDSIARLPWEQIRYIFPNRVRGYVEKIAGKDVDKTFYGQGANYILLMGLGGLVWLKSTFLPM